jgi:D-aminopeptidase
MSVGSVPSGAGSAERPRPRELGLVIGSLPPGPLNAITDVAGVQVGHATVIRGEPGLAAVRTGVTVVLPHTGEVGASPVFAAPHTLNGNGEMTGLEWIRECGMLTSPVAITNTHSVGIVRDALIAAELRRSSAREGFWRTPVVAETWDGVLNDCNGMHVTAAHLDQAVAAAASGRVAEGGVGGGTGMICHGFKGGIGTASRLVSLGSECFTVGVLVQANYGRRDRLRINGFPVGQAFGTIPVPAVGGERAGQVPASGSGQPAPGAGSIIVIIATDAPLLPGQCARLAQRAGLGVARTGGVGEHYSGDLFLTFATGNRSLPSLDYGSEPPVTIELRMLVEGQITPLFDAVVEATEEAIISALFAGETMAGRWGTAHALPVQETIAMLADAGRLGPAPDMTG